MNHLLTTFNYSKHLFTLGVFLSFILVFSCTKKNIGDNASDAPNDDSDIDTSATKIIDLNFSPEEVAAIAPVDHNTLVSSIADEDIENLKALTNDDEDLNLNIIDYSLSLLLASDILTDEDQNKLVDYINQNKPSADPKEIPTDQVIFNAREVVSRLLYDRLNPAPEVPPAPIVTSAPIDEDALTLEKIDSLVDLLNDGDVSGDSGTGDTSIDVTDADETQEIITNLRESLNEEGLSDADIDNIQQTIADLEDTIPVTPLTPDEQTTLVAELTPLTTDADLSSDEQDLIQDTIDQIEGTLPASAITEANTIARVNDLRNLINDNTDLTDEEVETIQDAINELRTTLPAPSTAPVTIPAVARDSINTALNVAENRIVDENQEEATDQLEMRYAPRRSTSFISSATTDAGLTEPTNGGTRTEAISTLFVKDLIPVGGVDDPVIEGHAPYQVGTAKLENYTYEDLRNANGVTYAANVTPIRNTSCTSSSTICEGAGTLTNPYVIYNANQLQRMDDDLNAHYVLANDIDASNTQTWNTGLGFEPIGNLHENELSDDSDCFNGSLNGRGYVIRDLHIDRTTNNIGLIACTSASTTLIRIGLESPDIRGGQRTGSLVGFVFNGLITNNYANDVRVRGTSAVGGFVGRVYNSLLTRNYVTGNIRGDRNVGGVIGRKSALLTLAADEDGNIPNVSDPNSTDITSHLFFRGTVEGSQFVGGITGDHTGHTSNAYVIDSEIRIKSGSANSTDIGGFFGYHIGEIYFSYMINTDVIGLADTQNIGIGIGADNTWWKSLYNVYIVKTALTIVDNVVGNKPGYNTLLRTQAQLECATYANQYCNGVSTYTRWNETAPAQTFWNFGSSTQLPSFYGTWDNEVWRFRDQNARTLPTLKTEAN